MVAPITGPFIRSTDTKAFYQHRKVFKQAKPHNLALGYDAYSAAVMSQSGNESTRWASMESNPFLGNDFGNLVNQVRMRAYDALKGQLTSEAQLGAAMVQWEQSYKLIYDAATRLRHVANAFRRGNVLFPTSGLKGSRKPSPTKPKSKDYGGWWLEYSFGWAPTIADIYGAVDVLQNPLKSTRIRASRSGEASYRYSPPASQWTRYTRAIDDTCRVTYGAEVAITNPNLYLANQLGLLNPAAVLWQVFPFSFLVDWVFNVEQVLNSMSDFAGLTLQNAYTTTKLTRVRTYHWTTYGWVGSYQLANINRSTGIVTPSLGARQAKAWGLGRAANAVALLAQCLKSF